MPRDIVLAGIPRGGTTLACVILNKCSNVVALNEPFDVAKLASFSEPHLKVQWLKEQFSLAREGVMLTGSWLSKARDGKLVSNVFSDSVDDKGLRRDTASLQLIPFPRLTGPDFDLIVKHPNAFTVLLPSLREHFECFAIIRNPLAVLLSWNSTHAAWLEGHVPVAEQLDEHLHSGLSTIASACDRQLFILAHYFTVIKAALPAHRIVRYEDIILTGGSALSRISPQTDSAEMRLSNQNTNCAYDKTKAHIWHDRLLRHAGAWSPFYSNKEIEDLLSSLANDQEP